ncbi:MAG: hypothetical protein HYZ34_06170 [Ignavibacteriae bacterium]|nr:hypothetical protein [Ignavibacteriota bacterium]
MNAFQSFRSYEEFIYTLRHRYDAIVSSTLILVRRGKRTAVLQGELLFEKGFRLSVRERLTWERDAVLIESYGYELWHHEEKISWYDSQPHPDELTLVSSFPHHKHVQPNIRSNRVPAPDMSFFQPNLPALIQEIELFIKQS